MAPTPPVDTGATPTRTPASVGFGPAVAVRVNLLWTATDTLLRTRIGRNGKHRIDGYRDTSGRVHAQTISGGDGRIERSGIGVSVGRRAASAGSGITKSPAASDSTNTTGRCTSKAHCCLDLS